MSSNSISLDEDFYGNDAPLKRPPTYVFISAVISVTFGFLIGIFGVLGADTASNSKEYLIGTVGYVLTALIPIILLQISRNRHATALSLNQEEPYDSYAGQQMESKFLKVVLIGLIAAGLSIWVFFLPIAEKFAA